jgi:hypothetical protein
MQVLGLTNEKSDPGTEIAVTLTGVELVLDIEAGREGGVIVLVCTVPNVRPLGFTETVGIPAFALLVLTGIKKPVLPLAALHIDNAPVSVAK